MRRSLTPISRALARLVPRVARGGVDGSGTELDMLLVRWHRVGRLSLAPPWLAVAAWS